MFKIVSSHSFEKSSYILSIVPSDKLTKSLVKLEIISVILLYGKEQ